MDIFYKSIVSHFEPLHSIGCINNLLKIVKYNSIFQYPLTIIRFND